MTYRKMLAALGAMTWISSCTPMPAMASECAVIGDSIASAQGLGGEFPECHMNAKIGIPASAIVERANIHGAKFVIVSAGSNPEGSPLWGQLERIRGRIEADEVVWIVPHAFIAGGIVRKFAADHGDKAVGFAGELHPYSYQALARDVRKAL
jgi:hypothetical protein